MKKYRVKKLILMPGSMSSPPARFRILHFYKYFQKLSRYNVKIIAPIPDRGNRFPAGLFFLNTLPNKIKTVIRFISLFFQLTFLKLKKNDIIITNRDIVPENSILFFEKFLFKKGVKIIFDFDDMIYNGKRKFKLEKILPDMSWIIAGNKYLYDQVKHLNNKISIIPTVVDTIKYKRHEVVKSNELKVIGWSGSSGTQMKHLPLLKPIIEKLSTDIKFKFLVIGENINLNWKHNNIVFEQWSKDSEIDSLKKIDIGLMPLTNDMFDKGKCGAKAIQYMALGIPAIVSPVKVNKIIVDHGVDGYHAKTVDEWVNYIKTLITDDNKRINMGKLARQKVEKHFSLNSAFEKWESVLNNF